MYRKAFHIVNCGAWLAVFSAAGFGTRLPPRSSARIHGLGSVSRLWRRSSMKRYVTATLLRRLIGARRELQRGGFLQRFDRCCHIRDRDGTCGGAFRRRVAGMGIKEVLIAQHSPWQNPYVERVISFVRRECLKHVIILNERRLRRILSRYLDYYHGSRTHLSLVKDSPNP